MDAGGGDDGGVAEGGGTSGFFVSLFFSLTGGRVLPYELWGDIFNPININININITITIIAITIIVDSHMIQTDTTRFEMFLIFFCLSFFLSFSLPLLPSPFSSAILFSFFL